MILVRPVLKWLLLACSKDESRGMCGVHVDSEGWTSTDGPRMHHYPHPESAERPTTPVTLSAKDLTKALSKRGDVITFSFHSDHAAVQVGKNSYRVGYVTVQFPPWSRVTPKSHTTRIKLDSEPLLEMFRLWSYEQPPVVSWGQDHKVILQRDIMSGAVSGYLKLFCGVSSIEGKPVTMGLDDRYAFEALSFCGGQVTVELGHELDPVVFRNGGAFAVVMPRRI